MEGNKGVCFFVGILFALLPYKIHHIKQWQLQSVEIAVMQVTIYFSSWANQSAQGLLLYFWAMDNLKISFSLYKTQLYLLLKRRWMDTILSLYNEILMVFSVNDNSSTALEFHIEKPHGVRQTGLILGYTCTKMTVDIYILLLCHFRFDTSPMQKLRLTEIRKLYKTVFLVLHYTLKLKY